MRSRATFVRDDFEPVARRVRLVALDDLDHVAVFQHVVQRHELLAEPPTAVLRGDAHPRDMLAQIGMHPEGEIERCRASGQLFRVASGREDVNLLAQHVALHGLQRALGRRRTGRLQLLLPVFDLLHPGLQRAAVALASSPMSL